ncbi:hypothetical protein VTI74DRAFT_4028 [Chaetomium olivicolor]
MKLDPARFQLPSSSSLHTTQLCHPPDWTNRGHFLHEAFSSWSAEPWPVDTVGIPPMEINSTQSEGGSGQCQAPFQLLVCGLNPPHLTSIVASHKKRAPCHHRRGIPGPRNPKTRCLQTGGSILAAARHVDRRRLDFVCCARTFAGHTQRAPWTVPSLAPSHTILKLLLPSALGCHPPTSPSSVLPPGSISLPSFCPDRLSAFRVMQPAPQSGMNPTNR